MFFYNAALNSDQVTAIRNGGAAFILSDQTPPQTIKITSASRGANFVLTWTSTAGKTYSVQYTEKLGGAWTAIGSPVGQAGTTTFTDSDATRLAKGTGFYRVVLPP